MKYFLIHLILFVSFYCELMMNVSARSVCPSISIRNGFVKRRGKGRMVRFNCNRTYLLAGEKHSTCIHGKWDPSPPKCVRPTCKSVTLLHSNDKVLIYPTHNGAVQHFFCKPGYSLNGPSDIYCDGYKWDNSTPTCLAINTKPKLSCDFEDEDLCGWTHDLNHDFDWRRENYGTPSGSIGTGPTFDHTKGVGGDGHYMYIESSARNENDTARLISPIYDKMNQEVCLEFYYHMFGSTIGSLRVYLKKSKDTWSLDPNLAVFSKSGNQGDKWYRGYQHLGVIDDYFQIIFEGVRGSGYVSDIAIDDVKIITDCPDDSGYSTQSDSPNTDIIATVDSCENRCGQIESTSSDYYHITCDCDDDCYYKRRCCPDYYDFCFLGYESTFSYEETATEISNVTDMIEDTSTETYYSTADTTKPPVNDRITFRASNRTVFTSSTVPNRSYTRPTRSGSSTSSNVTQTTTTQRTLPKLTRPIIYVRPPPPTTKVIRKVIAKYTTKKPTTPGMIFNNPQPTVSFKEIDSDAIDLPQPKNNDEGLLLTELPEDNRGNSKELWSNENENSVDSPFFRPNVGESGKLLFSQKESDSSSTNVFVIVISVIGTVVFISVAVFAVFWKYRRSGHRMHFSNGESQSDVRFLTSDEIIDFSLSDCYDE